MTEFEAFPKIPRYEAETFTITEKIDGTNACLMIGEDGALVCQSRSRIIEPGDDNFGFALWAHRNREQLVEEFGPGRHFGEWWGAGIQRRYGQATKRFSPFNVHLWPDDRVVEIGGLLVSGVPILIHESPIRRLDEAVIGVHEHLRSFGSVAAPGFMNPEGCMIYLHRSRQYIKAPLDPLPKGIAA